MHLFCEMLAALYANPADETVRKAMADRIEEDDNPFPSNVPEFRAWRAEYIRRCCDENRREYYQIAKPEAEYLTEKVVRNFVTPIRGKLSKDRAWKGNEWRAVRKGRIVQILARVRHPERPKSSVQAAVKLEVRNGFVFRITVCPDAWLELMPELTRAFPEAPVNIYSAAASVFNAYRGIPLGEYPGAPVHPNDVGAFVPRLAHVPNDVFGELVTVVRERGWRPDRSWLGGAYKEDDVVIIKPGALAAGAHAAMTLALNAASTRAARKRAGIAHHFGWWNDLTSPERLSPAALALL